MIANTNTFCLKPQPVQGWDCPRAQVLVMFRDIKSEIFSTQTIGRILRVPIHAPAKVSKALVMLSLCTNFSRKAVTEADYGGMGNKPKTLISTTKGEDYIIDPNLNSPSPAPFTRRLPCSKTSAGRRNAGRQRAQGIRDHRRRPTTARRAASRGRARADAHRPPEVARTCPARSRSCAPWKTLKTALRLRFWRQRRNRNASVRNHRPRRCRN